MLGRMKNLDQTRQVTSLELTERYLARLHRDNPLLNNVVTFLGAGQILHEEHRADDRVRREAEAAGGVFDARLVVEVGNARLAVGGRLTFAFYSLQWRKLSELR